MGANPVQLKPPKTSQQPVKNQKTSLKPSKNQGWTGNLKKKKKRYDAQFGF